MPGCQRIPQRRHVELVANSETGTSGSMGLKKARVCMPYRGLCACHEVCPVRDCSAPVVPRQEEFSGAATGNGASRHTCCHPANDLVTGRFATSLDVSPPEDKEQSINCRPF